MCLCWQIPRKRKTTNGKGKRPQQKRKPKLKKNQCAYCKKMGHWVKDCPKKPPKRDKGGQGSDPLPEPRVTLKVEGKSISFLGDTRAQYSVQAHGKLSSKKSLEPGATGMNQDAWSTRRRVNLRTGQVSHSSHDHTRLSQPPLGEKFANQGRSSDFF